MRVKGRRPYDVLTAIPSDLPEPFDDGACDHLTGMILPELTLTSNHGKSVRLAALKGWTVLYIYPMTGTPGVPVPNGWADIPGAAGCTLQSCAFRDSYPQLKRLSTTLYGISSQSRAAQAEAAERLSLPYELLSDCDLELANALRLPLIEISDAKFIKRITLVCFDSVIEKYFYPVFPPNENADNVVQWLMDCADGPWS